MPDINTTTTGLGLKAGDKAAISWGHGNTASHQIVVVEAVTPTGRIRADNGYEFNPDGSERNRQRDRTRGAFAFSGRRRIVPLTAELRAEIEDKADRSRLGNQIHEWAGRRGWRDYSTADLSRVAELIMEIEAAMAAKGG